MRVLVVLLDRCVYVRVREEERKIERERERSIWKKKETATIWFNLRVSVITTVAVFTLSKLASFLGRKIDLNFISTSDFKKWHAKANDHHIYWNVLIINRKNTHIYFTKSSISRTAFCVFSNDDPKLSESRWLCVNKHILENVKLCSPKW